MAPLSTLGTGGTADWYAEVTNREHLHPLCAWAGDAGLPVLFLGEGSNVVFPDGRLRALILRNRISGRHLLAGGEVDIGGAESLGATIDWLNAQGWAGLECLAGIPGTVGGAVVGNAGAYGQEIGDRVVEAWVWTPAGERRLGVEELAFGYRGSSLQHRRDWFLTCCRLRLAESGGRDLPRVSRQIVARRRVKYPPGLMCPGSFFKNVPADNLDAELRESLESWSVHGKIPAGRLLEAVGAKGARRGSAAFAAHHGNLLLNLGGARSEDILWLANEYAGRVRDHFGLRLEPEVTILDTRRWPLLAGEVG